ncbi:mCG22896, isoform CRA_a, partial [Mus musculus]
SYCSLACKKKEKQKERKRRKEKRERKEKMRFQPLFWVFFIFAMSLLFISEQKPVNFPRRRKLYRHNCFRRRCIPLHSRVPFP